MATRTLNLPAWLAQTPQPWISPSTLSEQRYLLRGLWAPAAGWGAGAWLLELYAADGAPIAPAVQLVLSSDFWEAYKKRDPRVPPGRLEVVRLEGGGDPGAYDLGASVELRYTD